MLGGQVLVIASACAGVLAHDGSWAWTSIVGYTVFMCGAVLLAGRYLDFETLEGRRRLTVVGVLSGCLAVAIAVPLELGSNTAFGVRWTLWLVGPIEESAKLVVPLVLLAAGWRLIRDPRSGVFVVVVSAATFGGLEGTEWEGRTRQVWEHVAMSMVRPGAELFHPFVTGFAAGVIWLAAARAGRLWTRVGAGALLVVIAVHSVHDGIADLALPRGTKNVGVQPIVSASTALERGLLGGVVAWALSLMFFIVYRHAARELVDPRLVRGAPPRWRPRIKQWGCGRDVRSTRNAREGGAP